MRPATWITPVPPKQQPKGRKVAKLDMAAPVAGGKQATRDNHAFLKPRQSERAEQAAFIQWWSLACKTYRLPEWVLYAVPNGAVLAGDATHRAIQMNNLKRTGLRKGAVDLNLDVPVGEFHGLRLELKIKPNHVSPEQQAFLDYYTDANYCAVVCWSAPDAIDAVKRYLARTL